MGGYATDFHFLRPAWLLALVPAAVLVRRLLRRRDPLEAWRGIIAEHLLPHLLVGEERRGRLGPVHVLALFWVLSIVAVAGPSWRREPAPFADERAALVIAVEVTPTMTARDIQPSRLERAAQKIHDLLERRPGARTALVAYAGSAHLVVPLTVDARIVEMFAGELTPEIMPEEGDGAAGAVRLADELLAESGRPGSVLLITDGVEADQVPALEAYRRGGGAPVHVLAVAAGPEAPVRPGSYPAPALDREGLERAAHALRGSLTIVTPDDRDVRRLARRLETSLAEARPPEGGRRWRDEGYRLVPLVALLSLLWFRRGWVLEGDDGG